MIDTLQETIVDIKTLESAIDGISNLGARLSDEEEPKENYQRSIKSAHPIDLDNLPLTPVKTRSNIPISENLQGIPSTFRALKEKGQDKRCPGIKIPFHGPGIIKKI